MCQKLVCKKYRLLVPCNLVPRAFPFDQGKSPRNELGYLGEGPEGQNGNWHLPIVLGKWDLGQWDLESKRKRWDWDLGKKYTGKWDFEKKKLG